ncbi:MAG: hypothetical protein PCFJNLEI_03658 [Verrucomicrobiae bacterium]|nr:hypothetical protein [Verrucomicrobiae bacterium]
MSELHTQPTDGETHQPDAGIGAGWPAASAAGAPPLPCQTGTISDGEEGKKTEEEIGPVNKPRTLRGMLRAANASGYWWKAIFTLVERVKELAEEYGIERLGFLTLTFADKVDAKREAERRFNNFARRVLDARYLAWIKVFERGGKKGRLHFHLLVVTREDIRTGFNFDAYKQARSARTPSQRRYWTRIYGPVAPEALRAEWQFLRGVQGARGACAAYGFGRHELTPIRVTGEAVGRYLGKYLAKGLLDGSVYKGERRLSYSRRAWRHSPRFCSVDSVYRKKLSKIANALGLIWTEDEGFADFKYLLGPRWVIKLRDIVQSVLLKWNEYPADWMAIRDYETRYSRTGEEGIGIGDVVTLSDEASEQSLSRALWAFARKVWNGTSGSYCQSIWELQELADKRCYPGVPF